jgi:hypothetical protein
MEVELCDDLKRLGGIKYITSVSKEKVVTHS